MSSKLKLLLGSLGVILVVLFSLLYDYYPLVPNTKMDYIKAINNERKKHNYCGVYGMKEPVSPLRWSKFLNDTALEHTKDMGKNRILSHTGSGTNTDRTSYLMGMNRGSNFRERIFFNNARPTFFGENIARGDDNLKHVMSFLISKDSTCKNIMDGNFTQMGMALYKNSNETYWSVVFGNEDTK